MSQAARLQARQRFFNLVVTNVPGPQFPLYLLGRRAARALPRRAAGPEPGARHRDHELQRPAGLRPARRLRRAARPRGDRRAPRERDRRSRRGRRRRRAPRAHRPGRRPHGGSRAAEPRPETAHVRLGSRAACSVAPRPEPGCNATVGDLAGNEAAIRQHRARQGGRRAARRFPELALTGYPPEDLLLKRTSSRQPRALDGVAARPRHRRHRRLRRPRPTTSTTPPPSSPTARSRGVYRKRCCPTTASSTRALLPRRRPAPLFDVGGVAVGVTICEDIWYPDGPIADAGAGRRRAHRQHQRLALPPGKRRARERMLASAPPTTPSPLVYVNLVGGQDELVFDGAAGLFDARRRADRPRRRVRRGPADRRRRPRAVTARLRDPRAARGAQRRRAVAELARRDARAAARRARRPPASPPLLDADAEVYHALVLGTRDYVRKNGFEHVVSGSPAASTRRWWPPSPSTRSGAEHVTASLMPSPLLVLGHAGRRARAGRATSASSCHDPDRASRWSATTACWPPLRRAASPDITEENIQARIRGNLLMALSNKFGWLVLTTGNKSEMAVGYSTLYGDIAGGFAVIKDMPEDCWSTGSCRLRATPRRARRRSPSRSSREPPSAELRPDQTRHGLAAALRGPRPILGLRRGGPRREQLIARGLRRGRRRPRHPPGRPRRVQAPPEPARHQGHHRAFGRDRRVPITNRYRG